MPKKEIFSDKITAIRGFTPPIKPYIVGGGRLLMGKFFIMEGIP